MMSILNALRMPWRRQRSDTAYYNCLSGPISNLADSTRRFRERRASMGNTCASLHVAWRGSTDEAAKAVSRAYGKLGYAPVKKKPADGDKHAVLLAPAGQAYVSVYDSDNAK